MGAIMDTKRINVYAPIKVYQSLKSKAAKENKTVTDVVLELVDMYLTGKVKLSNGE